MGNRLMRSSKSAESVYSYHNVYSTSPNNFHDLHYASFHGNYEKVKELHEKEVAESKKQEFYKNNHERIMALIEQDDKKKEIAESAPTTVEKVEEVEHPKLKKLTSSFCNINTNRRRL